MMGWRKLVSFLLEGSSSVVLRDGVAHDLLRRFRSYSRLCPSTLLRKSVSSLSRLLVDGGRKMEMKDEKKIIRRNVERPERPESSLTDSTSVSSVPPDTRALGLAEEK